MPAKTVQAIIETAAQYWSFANDIEITLEANPSSVEAQRFVDFRAAGINRVSLGVQALNDDDLRKLGRLHTAAEARAAVDLAMTTFDRASFDLIYARQDQALANWGAELSEAISWGSSHLSLYQLTIEDGTAFGDRFARGTLPGLPSEGLGADMYDLTQDMCDQAGLGAYEVSNHAKPGQESRHNQVYWRYGDYAGVGPGAHGRLTLDDQRYATETFKSPTKWLSSVSENGTAESLRTPLPHDEQWVEFLLFGLRLSEGIDMTRYSRFLDQKINKIKDLVESGHLQITQDRLVATANGRLLLNALVEQLI